LLRVVLWAAAPGLVAALPMWDSAYVSGTEYRDLFKAFDREHKGSVTLAHLLSVSQQLGLPSNQTDLDKLLAHANVNGTRPTAVLFCSLSSSSSS